MVDALPIDRMSHEENIKFRRRLEERVLTEETIKQIKKAFDLDNLETSRTVIISCDEAHAHTYSCLGFENPYSEVVLRLINEINHYKGLLVEIGKKAEDRK